MSSLEIEPVHSSAMLTLEMLIYLLGRKCSKEAILTAQARVPKMQMTEIFGEDEGDLYGQVNLAF